MENSGVKYVLGAMARLLRPLVKLLLEKGISYDQAADVLRKTYCDVAFTDAFALPGRKQTDSRVSVLTGLHRKDVARLKEMTLESPELMQNYSRAERVVTGWVLKNPDPRSATGTASLPLDGHANSFSELVKLFSGDMPARAVLDELERIGAVKVEGDRVSLLQRQFIRSIDSPERYEFLGQDAGDLIGTITHNLSVPKSDAIFQRHTMADNVPLELVEIAHQKIKELALPMLESAQVALAQCDREGNPLTATGTQRHRVTMGVYFARELLSESPGSEVSDLATLTSPSNNLLNQRKARKLKESK